MTDADVIVSVRAAIPDVQAIYGFGSTARGDASHDRDVDVATLAPHPLDRCTGGRSRSVSPVGSIATSTWSTCAR